MSVVNGYAAPVVRVFNPNGTEVFERVTTFSYMHSEKIEDASRIVIETDDITLVDHPDLQEGKALKVVFGLMGGKFFRAHLVWIWDISSTFNAQGLRLEIIGYCKAAYMRLNSSKDVFNDSSLEDVASKMADAYGMGLVKENLTEGVTEDALVSSIPLGGVNVPQYNLDANSVTVARDKTSYVITPYILKKHKTLPQANKSDAKLLEQTADLEPTDGILVEGRDDKLIIKRRNLYQAPFKAYKYKGEPGYLIDFSPALKNGNKRKEATSNSVSGWEEDIGEYFQGMVSHSQSGAGLLGDLAQLTTEEKILKDTQAGLANPFDQNKTVDGLVAFPYAGTDAEGKPFYKQQIISKLDSTQQTFVRITKQGTKASVFDLNTGQNSAAIDRAGRITTTMLVPVDPKEFIPSTVDGHKDAAGQGVNRQSKKELELEECNATILGDPELRSGRIISILGVGRKYSGNYYIISCDHEISPTNGYLCRLVIAKNAKNKTGLGEDDFNTVDGNQIQATKNKAVGLPSDGTSELFEVPLKADI